MPGMKHCRRCDSTKSTTDFPRNRNSKDGYYTYCKTCNVDNVTRWRRKNPEHYRRQNQVTAERHRKDGRHWAAQLRYKFGMEPTDYFALLDAQQGRCAICRTDQMDRAHVDHDHDTGKVRGLLCGPCNQGIGLFRDEPERLEAAATYLRDRSQ